MVFIAAIIAKPEETASENRISLDKPPAILIDFFKRTGIPVKS
jgi:hypothetical protein